ncbi:MAG: PilW family protein [Candidatus Binatia bacterium]
MSRIFWDRGGFTITELLVAMLFAGIVVATLYGFFRDQLFTLLSQETKTATLEDARGGLNLMARELRNAGSWGTTGTAPAESTPAIDDPDNDADSVCNRVYAASSTSITVQTKVNIDEDCTDDGETIKYELPDPTPSTCPDTEPGTKIINRNSDCLVANVVTLDTVTPPGPPLFTYFDSSNVSFVPTPSTLVNIKRVQITFRVQVNNPNPNIDGNIFSTLSTSVVLRNE